MTAMKRPITASSASPDQASMTWTKVFASSIGLKMTPGNVTWGGSLSASALTS